MRLALAQLNPLVGDLNGNGERILAACSEAWELGTDLVLTPELSLWGYPPRDLLLSPSRLNRQSEVLDQLAASLAEMHPQLALLVGIAEPIKDAQLPQLFNALALVDLDGWRVVARKQLLPTYDVFDEQRYFRAAKAPAVLELNRQGRRWRLGLTICEDLWVEESLQDQRLAGPDPIDSLLPEGIDLLLNLSASPFSPDKPALRQKLAGRASERLGCPVVYVNQVGGNDELIFDGGSFVLQGTAAPCLILPSCRESLKVWELSSAPANAPVEEPTDAPANVPADATWPDPLEQLFRALVLGVQDYARKCGFEQALLGLSGGIDSALVAVIAAAALGGSRVSVLLMPSPWSSAGSINDAQALAERLDLNSCTVPIAALMSSYDATLSKPLGQAPEGITAENLQSRIRGTLLMAQANQQGQLLLSTGNKSELAVGYCTLYGDMNGGLAVIGDIYKTTVFALCNWLDSAAAMACRRELGLPAEGELVGAAIRLKPPSAELRPDQRDSDSLPDYALLDPLLQAMIEKRISAEELIANGQEEAVVNRVEGLLRRAEFKRRQAPPLLKVSRQAFGSGWRLPIAAL